MGSSQSQIVQSKRLKDPTLFLPPKLLSHLLSSLSPQGLAMTNVLSRKWRRIVLSDPALHTEIDLAGFEAYAGVKDLVQTFQRLSSLSRHKAVKIIRDLSGFSRKVHTGFMSWLLGGGDFVHEATSYLNLLVNLIQASRESLQHLTLQLDGEKHRYPPSGTTQPLRLFK